MAYVPSRIACQMLGVHFNTLRKWADDGRIAYYRTASGQRRYDVDSFLRGISGHKLVCYCRVSSAKQQDDLARQVTFMSERFPEAEIVKDVGSGLNFKRPGLRSLLDRAMRGDQLRIVVAHRDRLARFGFDLIRFVVEHSGGEIVVLDDVRASPERELVDDLLAIVTVFSCRLHGRRNYKSKKDQAKPDRRAEKVLSLLDRLRSVRLQQDC